MCCQPTVRNLIYSQSKGNQIFILPESARDHGRSEQGAYPCARSFLPLPARRDLKIRTLCAAMRQSQRSRLYPMGLCGRDLVAQRYSWRRTTAWLRINSEIGPLAGWERGTARALRMAG